MLAPRNRGNLSAESPVVRGPAAAGRRAAGSVTAAAVAAVTLLLGGTGCDNPTHVADKQVKAAVEGADTPKRSTAGDPAVAAALGANAAGGPEVAKAAEVLPQLAAVDSRSPGTDAGWKADSAKLSLRQRAALSAAMRTAALSDLEAQRKQLQAAVDLGKPPLGSPAAQVDPLLRLSDLELTSGDLLAREAQDREVQAAVQVADVHRLLGQLRLAAADLDAMAAATPTASLQALDAIKAKAAGADASADWIGTGEQAIPAAAKVKAKVGEAEAEVQRLTAEKGDVEANAKKLQGEAAKARAEADAATGDIGLNLGKEAAAKAEEAAKLLIKVDEVQAKIDAKSQELAILKSREPGPVKAQELVDRRKQALADRWLSARAVLRQVATDVGSTVGAVATGAAAAAPDESIGGGATRPADPAKALDVIRKGNDITAKLGRVKALVEEADRFRGQAGDQYQSALGHVEEAGKDAAAAATAAKGLADAGGAGGDRSGASVSYADLLEPGQFQVRQAVAHLRLAQLAADAVAGVAARADLHAQADAAFAAAQASFKKADEAMVAAGAVDNKLASEPDALTKLARLDNVPSAVAELPTRNKDLVAKGEKTPLGQAEAQFTAAEGLLKQALGEADDATSVGDTNEVTSQELATVAGQSKQAALGVRANASWARSKLLSLAGDTAGATASAKAAIDQAKQYRGRYRQELPPGLPTEVQEKLGIAPASRPAIRPDGAATAPAATPGTAAPAGGTPPSGSPPGTPPAAGDGIGFLAPTSPPATAPVTPAVPATPGTPAPEGGTSGTPPVTPVTPPTPAPVTPPAGEGGTPAAPPATLPATPPVGT